MAISDFPDIEEDMSWICTRIAEKVDAIIVQRRSENLLELLRLEDKEYKQRRISIRRQPKRTSQVSYRSPYVQDLQRYLDKMVV